MGRALKRLLRGSFKANEGCPQYFGLATCETDDGLRPSDLSRHDAHTLAVDRTQRSRSDLGMIYVSTVAWRSLDRGGDSSGACRRALLRSQRECRPRDFQNAQGRAGAL